MNRHKLLERQIKRHLSDQVANDPAFQRFLNAVSESYIAYDRDNSLSDHAFRLSELEYVELNSRLKKELELKQESIGRLIDSIKMVDQSEGDLEIDQNNLLEIVGHLEYHINQRKQAEIDMLAAMDAAEKANMAKSDFLSIMSHEIRTPLNAVIGMAHLLLSTDPKPEQLQNLRVLKTSSESLLMLINDILDFSKIESGKLDLEEAPFSLTDLCLSLRDTHLVRANEKGIRLKVHLDSDIPEMMLGDALRMSQILNNLLSNAVKFTNEGQVDLSAEVVNENDGVFTLLIEVKDTGIGIPADKLEAIFTRFTQATEDTSRQFGGTGLGLAISKNLLELMGTTIQVRSELGHGAVFSFKVELRSVADYQPQKNDLTDFNLKGAKVLLVEDTAFNILFAKQLLEGWNAEVDVAENGRIALDCLEDKEYAIILMDLLMPELDGFSATLEIRKRKIKTPIIALTASATNNVRKRIELVGMQDYVTKPFSPKELFQKMIHQIQ